jgi:hypothetical protein
MAKRENEGKEEKRKYNGDEEKKNMMKRIKIRYGNGKRSRRQMMRREAGTLKMYLKDKAAVKENAYRGYVYLH